MTDELDRLFGRLVQALAETGPGRLAVPFASAELYERLVPYRSNRAKLNVATHQDYEMTVLRLLAGERGYARLEPADVLEALRRETAATNPDTALFRNFPDAQIMINRIAAERFLKGERAYAPPATAPAPAPPPPPPDQPGRAGGGPGGGGPPRRRISLSTSPRRGPRSARTAAGRCPPAAR